MLTIQLSLFAVFSAIIWATANKENSPIIRSKTYEYTVASQSKLLPKAGLNSSILCCLRQIRRNLNNRLIQQVNLPCKIACDLDHSIGTLFVTNISDSESSLSIRNKPQFDGCGQLNIRSGNVNGKLQRITLRIPFPNVRSHFAASWGTVREMLTPTKFRHYQIHFRDNTRQRAVYSKYELSTPITSTYHPGETNIDYRKVSFVKIPSTKSNDGYVTRTTRKSIPSYIRPTDVIVEDKQSYTLDTAEGDYLNSDPQIQVIASEVDHEIPSGESETKAETVKYNIKSKIPLPK
uniref:Bm10407 n=2 Tax=Brugia TaxID=6278 RepID=A0A1I9GDN8_BRUMA|nr:Bm10407 [Brugia malayi]